MAPELALEGPRAAGAASDQYALGLVLVELLTGAHPYLAPTQLGSLQRALSEPLPALAARGVPPDLERVCHRALARDSANRYPDLLAMAEDLARFLRGEPVQAPEAVASPPDPPPAAPPRRSSVARQITAVVLTLVAVLALTFRLASIDERDRNRAVWERRVAMETKVQAFIQQDDWAGAGETFDAYARFEPEPEHPVAAGAWLWWGRRLRAASRPDAARDAFAMAYAHSPDASGDEALSELTRTLRATRAWDGLEVALGALRTTAPKAASSAEFTRMQAELAVARGDLDAGLELGLSESLQPIARALRDATRTPWSAAFSFPWDIDGDGQREIGLIDEDLAELRVVSPSAASLPERLHHALPSPTTQTPVAVSWGPGQPEGVIVNVSGACLHLRPDGRTLRETGRWPCDKLFDAVAVPTGGVLIADNRELLRLALDGQGGAHTTPASGTISEANSMLFDLAMLDQDADGRVELWAGTAWWGSYDLRVLRADGDDYALVSRAQLGRVARLAAGTLMGEPMVAALQTADPARRRDKLTFGPELPHGQPQGIYLFSFADDRLKQRSFIPMPPLRGPTAWPRSLDVEDRSFEMFVADLDGDGRSELVLGVEWAWTCIYTVGDDGVVEDMVLEGVFPIGVANLDVDPADELLVSTARQRGELWVLGAGDARRPVRPARTVPAPQFPAGLDAGLRAIWDRVDTLVAIGLPAIAASRLDQLAQHKVGTAVESAALLRAGALLEGAGRSDEALALYARVADDPLAATGGMEAAFEVYFESRRFARALEIGRRRLALPDPPAGLVERTRALERRLAAPVHTLDFSAGLPPEVDVLDPTGLVPDAPARGLRHRISAAEGAWRVPLRSEGGPMQVEVTFTPTLLSWSGAWNLSLGELGEFVALLRGGGQSYQVQLTCPGDYWGYHVDEQDFARGVYTLAWELDPEQAMASCTISRDGAELAHGVYAFRAKPPVGELVATMGMAQDYLCLSEMTLHRVTFQGVTPVVPARYSVPVARSMVMGNTAEALALLDAQRSGAPQDRLMRAVVYDAVGRVEARDAELRALASGGEAEEMALERGLLLLPERMLEPLYRLIGSRAYVLMFRAHQVGMQMHPDRDEVHHAFMDPLVDLSQVAPARHRDPLEAVELHQMLTMAGKSLRILGRSFLAERTLLQSVDAGLSLREREADPAHRRMINRSLAVAYRELALVVQSTGGVAQAMDYLLRGLACANSPERFADQAAVQPGFAPLRADPRWAELEAARKLGASTAQ